MILSFTNYTACEDYTYGEQCTQTCTCNTSYTETCDGSSGVCTCMTGWEGRDCDVDVDECKRGTKKCDDTELQVCVNTPGSVHCECRYGGIDLNNCIGKCIVFLHLRNSHDIA